MTRSTILFHKEWLLLLPRSYLYVPADNPRFLEKAETSPADSIILDLEDGVHRTKKNLARSQALEFLSRTNRINTVLRVNNDAFSSERELINHPKVSAIFLPKVENSASIEAFIKETGYSKKIIAFIESAQALRNIDQIASHQSVFSVGLGEADLFSNIVLGEAPHSQLRAYARCQLIFACAAHSKSAPIAPMSSNFIDLEAFKSESLELRAMGYWGRACIHPAQIEIVNEVFSADPAKIEEAKKIIEILDESSSGAEVALDGTMIDAAHLRWAKNYLDRIRH